MIPRVVAKMSNESKASFEYFALQLQLLVSTATRVRATIESGTADDIEQVLAANDSAGICSQILKQACVQAGTEAAEIRFRHEAWTKNTENRVNRLARSADDAARTMSQLRAIEGQLSSFGGNMNEKSKKVMMGVAANNDKALVGAIFTTWYGYMIKVKSEKDIRDKFEAEIEAAEAKLMEYKQNQMTNVRNVLMRKAAEGDSNLMVQVWKAWADEVQETKREAGSQDAMKAIQAKLDGYAAAQAENTKKVMTRMTAGSDTALLVVVMGSWKQFIEEYKKNKEMEDAVKAQEQAMQEFLKKKKEDAKGVLDKMNASTDSGLIEHVISSWCTMYSEEKQAKKMDELMMGNSDRFASLNGRQKDNAKGVQSRINEQMDLNLMLRHFCAWALDAKLERIMRFYNHKMESKKNQLQSVQHMFRSFASQRDQGLRAASPRDSGRRRSDGSVSLPDIHAKP